VLSLILALAAPAQAAPGVIPIQGVLTDSTGTAVDGDVSVTFRLVSDDTGALQVWSDTVTVSATGGRFAVDLGASASLDLDLFEAHPSMHLGITVESDSEMPLVPMDHVPYAAWAENTGKFGGLTASEYESDILSTTDSRYLQTDYLPQWGSLVSVPAGFADGIDNDTTYTGTDFVVSNQACGAGAVMTGVSSSGGIVCETPVDSGFTTEAELTALLDDNYVGLPYTPTWGALDGIPAGFADGVDNDTIYSDADAIDAITGAGVGTITSGLITTDFTSGFSADAVVIPDNNPNGGSSSIVVPAIGGTVDSFTVSLQLTNSNVNAVEAILTAPDGSTYALTQFEEGSGTEIDTTYPAPTATLTGDLSTWIGGDPSGTWTLVVVDNEFLSNEDDGQFSWSINVEGLSSTSAAVNGTLTVTETTNLGGDLTVDGNVSFTGGGLTMAPRKMSVNRIGNTYNFTDATGTTHSLLVSSTSVRSANSHIAFDPLSDPGNPNLLLNIEGSSIMCSLFSNEDDAPATNRALVWATDGGNTSRNITAWGNSTTSTFMLERTGGGTGHVLSNYAGYGIICF
jgi:subtilisin-like proprotein convertase family protein